MNPMKKMLTLCSLVLALNGCGEEKKPVYHRPVPPKPVAYVQTLVSDVDDISNEERISIDGFVLSQPYHEQGNNSYCALYFAMNNTKEGSEVNERLVICYAPINSLRNKHSLAIATILLEAERLDNEEKPVTVRGRWDANQSLLRVESLVVKGREIKF